MGTTCSMGEDVFRNRASRGCYPDILSSAELIWGTTGVVCVELRNEFKYTTYKVMAKGLVSQVRSVGEGRYR